MGRTLLTIPVIDGFERLLADWCEFGGQRLYNPPRRSLLLPGAILPPGLQDFFLVTRTLRQRDTSYRYSPFER